ncbi:MAG: response regulator [Caldilineaceae bacterium]
MNAPIVKPILIAEDNDEDYAMIIEGLRLANVQHPVQRVVDGESCLAALNKIAGKRRLEAAFLLLDLNLPGIDGRTILAEIKQMPQLRALPIIVFTTSANPVDIASCYRSGANSYHLKPLEVPAFRRVIQEIANYWLRTVILPMA